jgi:hypothetical protein
MDDVLAAIRAFASGELSPSAFRDRLYSDERFEAFLSHDPHLRPGNYVGPGVYYFLIDQDYEDPGGVLNAQGALAEFMDRNAIAYTKTPEYGEFYRLLLDVQPGWLCVDPKYVQDHMLPAAGQRSGDELRSWLQKEFGRRFRYVGEPPRWIQSPNWPISENGPLVFLGQLEVHGYFHDDAAVYVFFDEAVGTCQSIVQVY